MHTPAVTMAAMAAMAAMAQRPVAPEPVTAAFTAAGRHVGDVGLWARDRLDAVRDRR
ncbi:MULTISPECIES: hypothetical protein [Streptomyces violaceusniger group]|uniref:hypothetical protein n=1 Tax=Streptomyces violaceusniger group TaxID=2839105 RepID=UPI00142D754D|nr:hypothetical protein [Streptomyces rhizosphaericus]